MLDPEEANKEPKSKMERLNSVISTSIIKGGLYGALVSIPTDLILTWRSPMYRWLGLRGRIFYHTIVIAAGANFLTEKEILKFENRIRVEEEYRRQKLIEASISSGDFMDDEDGEPLKINHKGGNKSRTDVSAVRLDRNAIASRGGGK